jgi:hypothetical protein
MFMTCPTLGLGEGGKVSLGSKRGAGGAKPKNPTFNFMRKN